MELTTVQYSERGTLLLNQKTWNLNDFSLAIIKETLQDYLISWFLIYQMEAMGNIEFIFGRGTNLDFAYFFFHAKISILSPKH